MGILSWIIIGGLAGWIASMIMGTNAQMGLMANIIVGIVGALIGGLIFSMLGANDALTGINLWSLFVAVIGSVILLGIVKAFRGQA
ncbi:MAG: GlsB/YeaQ/YmgE family stress response membrane protein [Candidatus Saccharimonadales bacterium]